MLTYVLATLRDSNMIGITRTRSKHEYKIRPKVARTNYFKYSFFHRYINDWNSLPSEVIGNLRTVTKFTTTTSVDCEKIATRTSFSAGKRILKMLSVGSRRRRH